MKVLLLSFFSFFILVCNAQNADCDTKLSILKKVFSDYNVTSYEDEKVFETKVWDKHATIAFKKCYVIDFENGIKAIAFNIYLSEDPLQYKYMVEEGISHMFDVEDKSLFRGGDQRLIQVLFYDTKNNRFLGKGKGFPLKGYTWLMEGMGDIASINEIEKFKKINDTRNACILTINECPDCLGGKHFVFKYHKGTILTSSAIDECYEKVWVDNYKLWITIITNCYENTFDGEPAQTEDELLFKWEK